MGQVSNKHNVGINTYFHSIVYHITICHINLTISHPNRVYLSIIQLIMHIHHVSCSNHIIITSFSCLNTVINNYHQQINI